MDFFARQDHARRQTKWLVAYFAVAVVLMIVTLYVACLLIFTGLKAKNHHRYDDTPVQLTLWNPKLFLGVSLGTLAIIFFGSAWKTQQLSGGGATVATLMGGRRVEQTTNDPDERKLLNVVEEMSIASGVPMPQVFVLEREEGINAFAAGHSTGDAAIGVTRGCIQMLSRDELQGVIGHEFSHVLNGDMRLNLRLLGIIFGILCLATIGRILLQTRSGSSRDRNALPILGIALLIIGGIGVFFGRLIQSAVSRQREFLADASSVQFTRNPGGLSGALQKIGRYGFGSKLESEHAPDLCHMFFGNGLRDPLFELMATHPPIDQRIRAIDSTWDGKFPPLKPEQFEMVKRAAFSELESKSQSWLGNLGKNLPQAEKNLPLGIPFLEAIATSELNVKGQPPVIRSQNVLPSIGNVSPLHLEYAEKLRDALPEDLKAAARDPLNAVALIYALLLSPDASLRATQISEIGNRFSPDVAEKTTALFPPVSAVVQRARLPLINLALGALRNLDAHRVQQFSETLQWLSQSDGKMELFEFVLQKIVQRNLAAKLEPSRPPVVQFYTLKPLLPDCAMVLSALAHAGSDDATQIQKAFTQGVPFLRAQMDADLNLLPCENCGVNELNSALDRLALAAPIIRKNLLEACARVIGADGIIKESEAELLRAVADTLDCPMPPLLAGE